MLIIARIEGNVTRKQVGIMKIWRGREVEAAAQSVGTSCR